MGVESCIKKTLRTRIGRMIFFGMMLFSGLRAAAQFYTTGEDPAGLKWNQVQIDNIQLIYPRGLDSMAFRYAYLFEKATPHVFKGIDADIPKIPVILHPYSTLANGLVAWTPKRMELYTLFNPEEQGNSWEKSLVIHESRHVAQMQRVGEHSFRGLHFLIGQQSEGIASGLFFSKHLYEGDAVVAETEFSNSGRGRTAEFLMPYKALFADSVAYSFDKYYMGSYRNYIPNHYAFGYMGLSAGRYLNEKKWEEPDDALSHVFTDVAKNPFGLGRSLQKNYGCSRVKLWERAQAFYSEKWQEEAAQKAPFDEPEILVAPEKSYVSYRNVMLIDSTIYAIKSSLSKNRHLVRLRPDGTAEFLAYTGEINSIPMVSGNKIYWTETLSGLRWGHESYSVLKEYDTETKKLRSLSRKSRYFHPAPSADGKTIALAVYQPEGSSMLALLNLELGLCNRILEVPEHAQLSEMIWRDEHSLFVLLIKDDGSSIYLVDLETETWENILPSQHASIHRMNYRDGFLYYGSDMDGTDNLCRLDLSDGQRSVLTNMRFGGFDYLIDGDDLYFSQYSRKGYELAKLNRSTLSEHLPETTTSIQQTVSDKFTSENSFNIDTLVIPRQLDYPVKKYNKTAHLFNIHSWAPFYYDVDELATFTFQRYYEFIRPGAILLSQNALGTFTARMGYSYHKGYHAAHLKMTYSGWYPVISLNVDYNDRTAYRYRFFRGTDNESTLLLSSNGAALTADLHSYIPFMFNSRNRSRGIIPSLRFAVSNDAYYSDQKAGYHSYRYYQMACRFYSVMNKSIRDIFPERGIGLNVQYMSAPFTNHYFTDIAYAELYAYFPGIMKNQAFRADFAWQGQHADRHTRQYLGSLMRMPSGFSSPFYRMEMFSSSLQYAIPLSLEFSIPSLLYVKRLQCLPFAEGLIYKENPSDAFSLRKGFYSAGMEILFDFCPLRLSAFEMTAGFRWSYTSEGSHGFSLVLSTPYW